MSKFWNWILSPLRGSLPWLILFTILLFLPQDINLIIRFRTIVNTNGLITFSVIKFICAFFTGYLLLLFANLFKGRIKSIVILVCSVFVAICSFADIVCIGLLGTEYMSDYLAIVLATNPVEVTEYLDQYLDWDLLFYLLLTILVSIFGFWIAKKIHFNQKWAAACLSCAIIVLAGELYFKFPLFTYGETNFINATGTLHKVWSMRSVINRDPSLNTLPFDVVFKEGKRPAQIVVIFGESLSADHCSLYGYEKQTQPHLEKLRNDSSLIVWKSAVSPATSTGKSFKQMMTTYDGTDSSLPYYSAPDIMTLVKKAGMSSAWLSNQTKTGLAENVITEFAVRADTAQWITELNIGGGGMQNCTLTDEPLLDLVRKFKETAPNSDLITFIHLQGSHPSYHGRTPDNLRKWNASDYPHYPESQRGTLADYDNSVLFNDSILSAIIQLYSREEAVIIYLSDHGQDLFVSSPDYCGHGLQANKTSFTAGQRIPMMVYLSEKGRRRLPELEVELRSYSQHEEPWNSTNLIYLIASVLKAEIKQP